MVITATTVITIIKKIIDISIVWLMVYILLKSIRNSVKLTLLFKGVVIIVFLKVISDICGFTTVGVLLEYIIMYGPLALIVIFQPEIRNILEQLGRSQLLGRHKTLTVDEREHLVYEIIQAMDYLRKNPQLKKFYLNDLHDSNIMVNPVNGDISIIDLDSAKIGKDTFFGARFLSPRALLNNTRGKYNIIDQEQNSYLHSLAYVDADRNTDLYCYTIMILNFLYKNYINNLSLEEYYEYLNYLESIGLNKELVDAFYCIVSNEENKNPSSYLESIDYKQLFMASKGEFVKKLKK